MVKPGDRLKAETIVEALPYMRRFYNKVFVVKIGGSALTDPSLRDAIAQDLVLLRIVGIKPIVVHGGGPEISELVRKYLKREPEFVEGLRVTDEETMEIVEMVLLGKISREIVTAIQRHGGRAVGISGKDDNFILAKKSPPVRVVDEKTGEEKLVDLGLVGEIELVNPELVNVLCDQGFIPVVSPIGVNDEGRSLNINADIAAGHIAAATNAEKLIMLTNVPGILLNPNDPSTLVAQATVSEAKELIKRGVVAGGMLPKVNACLYALEHGVRRAHIVDGRIPHSLLLEVFTDKGIGTMIVPG